MGKLIPIIILALLIIPIVSAADRVDFTEGLAVDYQQVNVHKINTSITVQTHAYNISRGHREISPTVSCSYDLYDLEGQQLITNKLMSYSAGDEVYQLVIHAGNFTKLGEMSYTIYCNGSNYGGYVSSGFTITQTGDLLTTGESLIYLFFLLAALSLLGFTLYGSIIIPYRNKPNPDGQVIGLNEYGYVKVICIVFSYVMLMWILGISRSIMFNYLFINGSYNLFNWAFQIMFALVWPLIVMSFLLILINYISTKKFQKALERGIPTSR